MPIDASISLIPLKMAIESQRNAQANAYKERALQGDEQYKAAQIQALRQKQSEFNLNDMANKAAFKAASGMQLDANDIAAIDAFSALKGGQTFVNPVTKEVMTQPSLRDNLQKMGRLGDLMPQPATSGFTTSNGMNTSNLGSVMGIPQMKVEDLPPVDGITDYNVRSPAPVPKPSIGMGQLADRARSVPPVEVTTPGIAGTPAARQMEAQAQVAVDKDLNKQSALNQASGLPTQEGIVPSNDDAKVAKDIYASYQTINDSLKRYETILNKNPNPVAGTPDAITLDQIKGQMIAGIKGLEQLGALDEGVQRLADNIIGDPKLFGGTSKGFIKNPIESVSSLVTKIRNPQEVNKNNIKNFREYLDSRLKNTATAHGYDPSTVLGHSADLPSGAKVVGTSGGKRVLQLDDGNYVMEQ